MKRLNEYVLISGFKKHGNIAYGRKNDIFFCIRFVNFYTIILTTFISGQKGIIADEIKRHLKQMGKTYKAAVIGVKGNAVSVSFAKPLKALQIDTFTSEFSLFLKAQGYISCCTSCGGADNLECVLHGDVVKEICGSCSKSVIAGTEQIRQERRTTGSYATGAAGAVLGGIIGIIPWILFALIGFISAISGFIMAYLSYKLYLAFKGKQGKGMFIIIIFVLIVFTYIGVMASDAAVDYSKWAEEGFDTNVFEIFFLYIQIPFMFDIVDVGPIWGEIALGWLFAGLGSFSIMMGIKKHGEGKDLNITHLDSQK
ncbi:MAG: hypothetical protein WDA65_04135 [Christensenellales bacterium]